MSNLNRGRVPEVRRSEDDRDAWPLNRDRASDSDDPSDVDSDGFLRDNVDKDIEYLANVYLNDEETKWIEPEEGVDRVLVVKEEHALPIVKGVKNIELRAMGVKTVKSGERIYIATSADKYQGRRAWDSPFPENQPRKSKIVGSVVFSHWEVIEWDRFDSLVSEHCVTDREYAQTYANKKDGKLRGWYFTDPVEALEPREYKFKPSSVIWRFFQGWK